MLKPIWQTWSRKASPLRLISCPALTGCDKSRHIQGNGKIKGMFHSLSWFKPHSYCCTYWAWRRSWTVSWSAQGMRRIIVLTDFCHKQLHVSQYNTLWGAPLQTTATRTRIGQTPNYSECLVRTHPSLTGPGIAILCIKCNYHWHCVLTLVIFSTIAQFGGDKTVSVARAPAWTLAGGFNVTGPTHASNELKNLPHEHVLTGSNNSSLSSCIVIQAWKVLRWHGKRAGIEATQRCVVSHTQRRWEFVQSLIRFQLFEDMPP